LAAAGKEGQNVTETDKNAGTDQKQQASAAVKENRQEAVSPDVKHKKPRKKKKPVMILLDLLIVAMALAGIGLIVQPMIVHWQQDRFTRQLNDSFDQGDGTISFFPDQLVVAGEDVEYFSDFDGYETDLTQPAETTATTPGETGTNGTVPDATGETTAQPTATPRPERIVVQAIGRIEIPRIKLSMPIAAGATNYNLRVAIGHYTPTADFGANGRSVLFGHRMYTYGRHFNRLGEMEIGDTIIVEDKTHRYTYTVDQIDRILPVDLLKEIYAPADGSRIMLVTCDPIRVASHRLLVHGELTGTERR
jgi:sortase A